MRKPYADPTTGKWIGERETRGPEGEVTRQTQWFATESLANDFAKGIVRRADGTRV